MVKWLKLVKKKLLAIVAAGHQLHFAGQSLAVPVDDMAKILRIIKLEPSMAIMGYDHIGY